MTTTEEAVREGSFPELDEVPESIADTGACARESVTLPASAAFVLPSRAVTERVRRAGELISRAMALLDHPASLVHSQPMTFKEALDWHGECARHYRHPFFAGCRMAWGWFHLLVIKPALNLAEWVTESPLRLAVAVALIAAIRIWS